MNMLSEQIISQSYYLGIQFIVKWIIPIWHQR